MFIIFMGFMLVWVKALPLIVICLVVFALLIYDFYCRCAARPETAARSSPRTRKGAVRSNRSLVPFGFAVTPRSAARRAAP